MPVWMAQLHRQGQLVSVPQKAVGHRRHWRLRALLDKAPEGKEQGMRWPRIRPVTKEPKIADLIRDLEFVARSVGKRIGPDNLAGILRSKIDRLETDGPYRRTMIEMRNNWKEQL